MASIRKRPDRPNRPWQARYRDLAGKEHARHFERKVDARRWLDEVTADLVRGVHVDPRAGQRTFGSFAGEWARAQTFDPSTREAVESRLRRHILPTFADMPLAAIRPSTVQAWVKGRSDELAPRTVRVLLANLSSIFAAAVADGVLASNPCASRAVRPPAVDIDQVVPWSAERVQAIIDAHPDRWRAVPVAAVGLGLRQGECFGLAVEHIDFLRRTVHVRRQVKIVNGRATLAPPKRRKMRDAPLPASVAEELAERIRQYPPGADGLVFTTRQGGPLTRSYYNRRIWRPALEAAGIEPSRATGMHQLRHAYITRLLSEGVNPRAVADWVGHSDIGYMLRVYGHVLPNDNDRARAVMDAALGRRADQVRTRDVE